MRIDFEEKEHIYAINGEIASISVTELLAKHKLSPDYSKVKKAKLKESSDKGKAVHKDLEYILNKEDYDPTTEQGKQFKEWVNDNLDCGVGEQMLGSDYKGMLIAGTADVMGFAKDSAPIIGDHKNTAKFHREYVSWQVSLLDYFARKLGDEPINGKPLKWAGAKKFYCWHYDPTNGKMTVYELEKVPDSEIERLIECEYNDEIYQRRELVLDSEMQNKFLTAEEYLIEAQRVLKQAEENAKAIREQMLSIFEQQGITNWKSPNGKIDVTYVAPVDKIIVDSKKLKSDYPQIYDKCQKLSKTKAQLRIKVKGDEDYE